MIIDHIPDYPGVVSSIPILPADLWENIVRIDNYLKRRMVYPSIIDIGQYSQGASSSSSMSGADTPSYYEATHFHPMADIMLVSPDALFLNDHLQPFYYNLPGMMGGPDMDEYNYLTYPGANSDIPGQPVVASSSS